jgi:predicted transcriptional regulator
MLMLEPEDTPITAGEVAQAIGISIDDATRALHELRSLGYAREEKRRYEATDKGTQVHGSLASARRDSLAAFVSALSEEERRRLADALRSERQG